MSRPIHGGSQVSMKGVGDVNYKRATKVNFTNASVTDLGNGYLNVFVNPSNVPVFVTATSSITIPNNADYVICNNTIPITLTLPAPTAGKMLVIKLLNVGRVTVSGAIENITQIVIDTTGYNPATEIGHAVKLLATNTQWLII